MAIKYNLVGLEDQQHITVVLDGEMYVADNSNANWDAIVDKVLSDDEDGLADLFSPEVAVNKNFEAISDRVAVRNGELLFDGDPVDNSLSVQVLRFLKDGVDDWEPLVAFLEKVQTNPSDNSREQLYKFLERHDFSIDADGDIIGYKSVNRNGDDGFKSVNSGTAYVNGVQHVGQIPQNVGDVVTMPRSEVADDANVACHTGLHVGNYRYVTDFFKHEDILLVKVNPRDVVSVPHDSNWEKVRVCRYEIVGTCEEELTSPIYQPVVEAPEPVVEAAVEDDEDYVRDFLRQIGQLSGSISMSTGDSIGQHLRFSF